MVPPAQEKTNKYTNLIYQASFQVQVSKRKLHIGKNLAKCWLKNFSATRKSNLVTCLYGDFAEDCQGCTIGSNKPYWAIPDEDDPHRPTEKKIAQDVAASS